MPVDHNYHVGGGGRERSKLRRRPWQRAVSLSASGGWPRGRLVGGGKTKERLGRGGGGSHYSAIQDTHSPGGTLFSAAGALRGPLCPKHPFPPLGIQMQCTLERRERGCGQKQGKCLCSPQGAKSSLVLRCLSGFDSPCTEGKDSKQREPQAPMEYGGSPFPCRVDKTNPGFCWAVGGQDQ